MHCDLVPNATIYCISFPPYSPVPDHLFSYCSNSSILHSNCNLKRHAAFDDADDEQRVLKKLKQTVDIPELVQMEHMDEPPVTLTDEQQSVVEMALGNYNIFLTCAA